MPRASHGGRSSVDALIQDQGHVREVGGRVRIDVRLSFSLEVGANRDERVVGRGDHHARRPNAVAALPVFRQQCAHVLFVADRKNEQRAVEVDLRPWPHGLDRAANLLQLPDQRPSHAGVCAGDNREVRTLHLDPAVGRGEGRVKRGRNQRDRDECDLPDAKSGSDHWGLRGILRSTGWSDAGGEMIAERLPCANTRCRPSVLACDGSLHEDLRRLP